MADPRESTYTQNRYGVSPETLSVISARNRIYAVPAWSASGDTAPKQIGVVATFNPSETRTIEPVRGIGYGDRVMELVPGMTEPMTMAVTRTAQYLSMIAQVFGYKGGIDGICRSLRHHKYPFDLRQELIIGALGQLTEKAKSGVGTGIMDQSTFGDQSIFPDGSKPYLQAIITLYEACWISDWNTTFASDTALVQEDVTIHVTNVVADGDGPSDTSTEVFASGAISSYIQGVKKSG
jgi:hypothetical protein